MMAFKRYLAYSASYFFFFFLAFFFFVFFLDGYDKNPTE